MSTPRAVAYRDLDRIAGVEQRFHPLREPDQPPDLLTGLFGPLFPGEDRAACRHGDPELWYPDSQGALALDAKIVCWQCPVRRPCLDYALENNEQHGVWGGLTARQRRTVQRLFDAGDRAGMQAEADRLADPQPIIMRRTRVTREVVAEFRAGASVWKLARTHSLSKDEVLGRLRDVGFDVEDPGEPSRKASYCALGHLVRGDNARRNGTHEDGRQRWECVRCGRARWNRRCVTCDAALQDGEPVECTLCQFDRTGQL